MSRVDSGAASTHSSTHDMTKVLRDLGIVAVIAAVSVTALKHVHFSMLSAPWQESFAEVLPDTVPAALRVWGFWLVGTSLLSALLLRLAPGLGVVDAVLGGAAGLWVVGYLLVNLLGPIGLLHGWTIWLLIALGVGWLWQAGPPVVPWRWPRPGQQLTLLAFVLILPTLVLLQLGSPIPPHFDTMAPPASAQRIVTFGVYLPFDNDPFGYWDAASQCPGIEVFYAFLTLGSGVPLALLAETGSMVPMIALLLLATYRFGRTMGGDLAGGFAALLMFTTPFVRSMPYGHGRFVAFIITSAGLALFLERRGVPMRRVLAALILGTAVASHAVIGALGMALAACTLVFWLLSGCVRAAFWGGVTLLGAALVAFPTIPIGLRLEVPYPVMPLVQLVGIGLAIIAARRMPDEVTDDGPWARPLLWALAVIVLVTMWTHPNSLGVLHDFWWRVRFPTLYVGSALGIACMMASNRRGWSLAPMVIGIGIGMIAEYVGGKLWTTFENPNIGVAVEGFVRKADFWYPYVLVLPTACFGAWLTSVLPRRAVVFGVLLLLIFPWSQYQDPNYFQHSIPESWSYQLQLAKGGYWGSTGHRRWSQSEAELEVIDLLRAEVAAGRITPETHVLHLTPYIYLYKDTAHYATFVGINNDLYVVDYKFDRATAGGRFYPGERVHEAIEARPRYVVVQDQTADGRKLADSMPSPPAILDEYEVLLDRDGIRLLRYPEAAGGVAAAPEVPGARTTATPTPVRPTPAGG